MFRQISRLFCGAVLLLLCSDQLVAQDGKPTAHKVKKLILPGESFLVEGRPSFVLDRKSVV